MMNIILTYFPEFTIGHSPAAGHWVSTNLRKKHKGIWYTIEVKKWGLNQDEAMRRFLRDVYMAAVFTKIDPLLTHDGVFGSTPDQPVYPVDPVQIDETERLKQPTV